MQDSAATATPGTQALQRASVAREPSVATRIALSLLAVVAMATGGLAWINQHVVLQTFAETERQLVVQNRNILERAIAAKVESLRTAVTDWAQWDDLYAYVQGENPEFGATELGDVVLDRLELDVILMIDEAGRMQYGDARPDGTGAAAGTDSGAAIDLTRLLTGETVRHAATDSARSPISLLTGSQETLGGLMDTPRGPMVLALRPISRTDGSGEAVGTLVMGRFLNPAPLITEISVLPSTVVPHGSGRDEVTDDMHAVALALAKSGDGAHLVTRRDDMSDFKLLRDLTGAPVQILETRMPRSIVATGRETTRLMLIGLLLTAAVSLLALISLIRGIVSTPLRRLTDHIRDLRATGERQATPGQERNDEIGVLARRFEELEVARHEDGTRLKLLAAAVEHAGDAIAILDADGRINYVNPQYERQTGLHRRDVIGQHPSHGESPGATYDEVWATVRAGRNWSGMLESRSRDGSIRHEHVTVAPIRNAADQITNFIAVMHDVTDRLHLQEQLVQAQKLEAVGKLAAGVAHEINTPTQYVSSNIRFIDEAFGAITGLLRKIARLTRDAGEGMVAVADLNKAMRDTEVDYLQAEVPVAIRQSLEGVDRVAEIVRSMRNLSHPGQEVVLTDLNSVVESATRVASSELHGIAEVVMDLDPGLPRVPCMAGGINQVVVNILVNAAQAIETSTARVAGQPGRIRVSTRRAGDYVEIHVTDNGSGMSEEVRARVFDPFFTTKAVGRGTGQGLSIAHNVVKSHKGSLAVESEPGRGACFIVRLPLAPAAVPGAAGDAAAA